MLTLLLFEKRARRQADALEELEELDGAPHLRRLRQHSLDDDYRVTAEVNELAQQTSLEYGAVKLGEQRITERDGAKW